MSPRWRKLVGDFRATRGRVYMMVAAIAIGLFAVTTFLTAYAILTREISRNYMATNPASALVEMDRIDERVLQAVKANPDIDAAEASNSVVARVRDKSGNWTPLLLFVVPDFKALKINRFDAQLGAWPPGVGTLLIERDALRFLSNQVGDTVSVRLPSGQVSQVKISGTTHDAGLAPAWQEQTAYGYVTPATFAQMGGDPQPHLLKVVVKDGLHDPARVDAVISRLALSLKAAGYAVGEIRIPPAGRHPHQTQMTAILVMMIIFGGLALILSTILTASMVAGMLAQQVRQIGVMKAIGARTSEIAGLYLCAIFAIAASATLIALPLGYFGGIGLAQAVSVLLNFDLASLSVPHPFIVGEVAVGLLLPLAFVLPTVLKATGMTVREAIGDYGTSAPSGQKNGLASFLTRLSGLDRTLLLALRNSFRRKARVLMSLTLLSVAGATFMASLNVEAAWRKNLSDASIDRRHDLELRFAQPESATTVLSLLKAVPGVTSAQAWSFMPASSGRADGLSVVRTYPDGGHGSFVLRSMPSVHALDHLRLLDGRSLTLTDHDGVILNQNAARLLNMPHPGQHVVLSVDGRNTPFVVIGIVREVITPATAYTSNRDFDLASGMTGTLNSVRLTMTSRTPVFIDRTTRAVETALDGSGIRLKVDITETRLDAAVSGHVKILIVVLVLMSILMAIVGALGLTATQGMNVTERTREFGIMRSIGATSPVIVRNVISEGLFIGVLSMVPAGLMSLPLSYGIGNLIGTLAFGLPLGLVVSTAALCIWTALIVVGSVIASLVPALRASQLSVRETLSYL